MVAALIDSLADESKEKKKGGSACRCCLSLSAEAPPKTSSSSYLISIVPVLYVLNIAAAAAAAAVVQTVAHNCSHHLQGFQLTQNLFSFSFFKRTDSPGKAGEFQVETMKHLKVWTDMRSLICKKGEKGEEKLSAGRLHITP